MITVIPSNEIDLPLKKKVNTAGYYQPEVEETELHPSRTRLPLAHPAEPLIPTEPLKKGEQYRFHFDMSRCVGCECCVVACNEQNNNPAEVNWRRVGEIEGGTYPATKRYNLSMGCNHCLDPACLTGCPTDAYVKLGENGLVIHREEECIGCGYCTWNCPYGVPQFNKDRKIVTKCDMCHSRLSDGLEPACVAACPEEAIRIEKVNISEWRENHSQGDAPHMPESGMTISTTRITLPKDIPVDMLKANRHRIEPEKAHATLIFMTVLTQLATGGFLTLWLGDCLSHVLDFLRPLQDFLAFGASGMLIVTGIALFASVFHLGRPLFAYKALRMWRRSWLSREVLFFAVFSFLGAVYAAFLLGIHFFNFPAPAWIRFTVGGAVTFSGLAGVYASAKIYLVPARPAWNTVRTPIRFFLTGFILGPLFGSLIYSLYAILSPGKFSSGIMGPVFAWLAVSGTAAFFQLALLLSRLLYLREDAPPELHDATFLLTRRFKNAFLSRIGLLVLGNFILPFWLFYFLTSAQSSAGLFVGFAAASFLLSLVGELLGRYLFFVTVVPKNIPGAFFTSNGGGH